jgi:putative NIF3 family GTP cyclohydrolase 1 type 2
LSTLKLGYAALRASVAEIARSSGSVGVQVVDAAEQVDKITDAVRAVSARTSAPWA